MKITEQVFTAQELDNLAAVLIWGLQTARGMNGHKFSPGENVFVPYDIAGADLAANVQARLLDLGLNPVMRARLPFEMEYNFLCRANDDQLVFLVPGTKKLIRNLHGHVGIGAPESLTHLKDIDPGRQAKYALAGNKYRRAILNKREDQGLFAWTLTCLPTEATAEKAGLSVPQFTAQIVKACFLDQPDPVGQWEDMKKKAETLQKWLNAILPDASSFHVESDRVDLIVTPGEKRKFVGITGHNIPSFEMFVSPDWRGTRGVYYADQPSYRSGNYVRGVRLEFKNGSAVKIEAEDGGEFAKKQLAMDRGAAKLGEFSLTDIRFSKIDKFMANTLFDENYGGRYGNCHIAVGSSFSDTFDGDPRKLTKAVKKTLGFNESALHWDLINAENKVVTALMKDGGRIVLYENGMFTY